MSWLVQTKILPAYYRGDPPAYASVTQNRPPEPVGWFLSFNDRRLGWALSEIVKQPSETTEIHSLVHFDDLPLDQFMPSYLQSAARLGPSVLGKMEVEVESNLLIDSHNGLVSFDSAMRPKKGQSLVHISGNVEGDKLRLNVRVGDAGWEPELPIPQKMVGDGLTPQMVLPHLRLGQSWTLISYSPMSLASRPLEVIQGHPPTEVLFAKVEEETTVSYNGRVEPMWLVVFRSDINTGPANEKNIRNRLWVRHNGEVVRQQVMVGQNALMFVRMSDQEAARLRAEHKEFNRRFTAEANHD